MPRFEPNLRIPGPTALPPSVREAGGRQMVNHRGDAPDALIWVDAIFALGAVPFAMDDWGPDLVVTGSQKAWMAAPGMAMAAVGPRAWVATTSVTTDDILAAIGALEAVAIEQGLPVVAGVGVAAAQRALLEPGRATAGVG